MSEIKDVYIDETYHKQLKKISAERGDSMKSLVEEALRYKFDIEPNKDKG